MVFFTHAPLTEDELKLILADSHKGGVVPNGKAVNILRAFEFADKQAEEVTISAEKVSYILDLTRFHGEVSASLFFCFSNSRASTGAVAMDLVRHCD